MELTKTEIDKYTSNGKREYYQAILEYKDGMDMPGSLFEAFKLNKEKEPLKLNIVSTVKFADSKANNDYIACVLGGIVYIPEKRLLFLPGMEAAVRTGIAFDPVSDVESEPEVIAVTSRLPKEEIKEITINKPKKNWARRNTYLFAGLSSLGSAVMVGSGVYLLMKRK